jgi:hypothetical protein
LRRAEPDMLDRGRLIESWSYWDVGCTGRQRKHTGCRGREQCRAEIHRLGRQRSGNRDQARVTAVRLDD